jgi:hypothetical protein
VLWRGREVRRTADGCWEAVPKGTVQREKVLAVMQGLSMVKRVRSIRYWAISRESLLETLGIVRTIS